MIPLVLVIAGLVFMFVGLVIFIRPIQVPPGERGDPGVEVVDIDEVLKQIRLIMERLDKRFRPGLVLMVVGLALVGIGAYLEAQSQRPAVQSQSLSVLITNAR